MSNLPKPHPAIRNFTSEQWDEMIDKLMGFTYQFLRSRLTSNNKNPQTPDGLTYEDITQEIIIKVLEGTRRWNPDKDGELLPYMVGQVKSLVNHGFNSWSARNVETMSENENVNNQGQTNEHQLIIQKSNTSPTPEFVLIGYEQQIERDCLLDTIIEAVVTAEDEELISLVDAYLDDSGEYKPGQIALRLGIPTTEFHNLRKRLIRCVQKYISKQSSETGGRDDRKI